MNNASALVRSPRVLGLALAAAAAGALVLAWLLAAGPLARQDAREGLTLTGQYRIEAYRDGALFAVREGHNALSDQGRGTIVLCLSGLNTSDCYTTNTPPGISGKVRIGAAGTPCSGVIAAPGLFSGNVAAFLGEAPATNTPVSAPSGALVGWRTSATLSFSSSATVTEAGVVAPGADVRRGAPPPVPGAAALVHNCLAISPGLSVLAGDTVIVNITFTVS